jgi:hypothetical protein
VRFTLAVGLFCGFNLRPGATDYLVRKLGFAKDEVTHLEYRGGEWPGGFLVRTHDGRQGFIPKDRYSFLNLMYVPRRCLVCPDLTNELADISVGDTWLEEYAGGWSTVISRSLRGDDVLKQAAHAGVVRLEELTRDQILLSHAHLFAYKKYGYFVRRWWLRTPLSYRLQEPPITMRLWLQQSLLLALIIILRSDIVRGFAQRLPLSWLGSLSAWGRKGAKARARR